MLPVSTVRTMHRISGEERHPDWGWWMRLLSLQTAFDRSVWARKVDHVLIGGDPLVICARIERLLTQWRRPRPIRIGLLHPGSFSGAPLAALEDQSFRDSTGIGKAETGNGPEAVRAIMARAITRMSLLLAEHSGGGVLACEMVQGLRDAERDEVVLKMTRSRGASRSRGANPSAGPRHLLQSRAMGEEGEFYRRSELYWQEGFRMLFAKLEGVLSQPPVRQNFADLVIADHCEMLSGFISPPSMISGPPPQGWLGDIVGKPYRLAGPPPATIGEAIIMWREDFVRAGKDPISTQDKEIDQ